MTDPSLDAIRAALPAGYELTRRISAGGQGAVFDGRLHGERIAIKVFIPTTDPRDVERRVEREVTLLQSIDCPYLVKIRDARRVVIDGRAHELIGYEFLDGRDLSVLYRGRRPEAEAVHAIGEHVGTAVEALWSKRIVHRDIKPQNVIQAGDRYVLVDVGFARHLDRSSITLRGNPGTHGYASPEQAMGWRSLTISSDVFSLGVTLYEIAAVTHPFDRRQERIGRVTPVPLAVHRPDLPSGTCALVDRMLAVRPFLRPTAGIGGLFRELANPRR